LAAVVVPVIAKGPHEPPGKSKKAAHLYLYQKDPANWQIVEGGAWGKMTFNPEGSTFDFVFNGHGLEQYTKYTLIYYPDPWPGKNLICLGSGTSNRGRNVHIERSVDTGPLPDPNDQNYPDGAKIWLVLFDDVRCGDEQTEAMMIGWNPTQYLFEHNLITFPFNDTDE